MAATESHPSSWSRDAVPPGHDASPDTAGTLRAWLPPGDVIRSVPVGVWWDVVRMPEALGLDVFHALPASDRHFVIHDTWGPQPRLYFLVPAGTTAFWRAEHTERLDCHTFIGVPGRLRREPPGPHWAAAPDWHAPGPLVPIGLLLAAVGHHSRCER
ncbi:hypothetical protein [Streptomyces sp. 7N604]|uniref:hypothetical protein n=1 Tax=Streptomyces sp. 7N604 TaxID=3457415 RepID=UPI003FD2A69B